MLLLIFLVFFTKPKNFKYPFKAFIDAIFLFKTKKSTLVTSFYTWLAMISKQYRVLQSCKGAYCSAYRVLQDGRRAYCQEYTVLQDGRRACCQEYRVLQYWQRAYCWAYWWNYKWQQSINSNRKWNKCWNHFRWCNKRYISR